MSADTTNNGATVEQDHLKGDMAMEADTTNNNTGQSQRMTALETNLEFIKEQLSDLKQDLKDIKQGQENLEARLNIRIDDLIKWYVPSTIVALLAFATIIQFL